MQFTVHPPDRQWLNDRRHGSELSSGSKICTGGVSRQSIDHGWAKLPLLPVYQPCSHYLAETAAGPMRMWKCTKEPSQVSSTSGEGMDRHGNRIPYRRSRSLWSYLIALTLLASRADHNPRAKLEIGKIVSLSLPCFPSFDDWVGLLWKWLVVLANLGSAPHRAESYQSVNDAPQPHSEPGPNSGTFVYMTRSGDHRRQLVTELSVTCVCRDWRWKKWNVWKEVAAIGHTRFPSV